MPKDESYADVAKRLGIPDTWSPIRHQADTLSMLAEALAGDVLACSALADALQEAGKEEASKALLGVFTLRSVIHKQAEYLDASTSKLDVDSDTDDWATWNNLNRQFIEDVRAAAGCPENK